MRAAAIPATVVEAVGMGVRRRRQILVLGNGAAGAEKQALALASKLQTFLPSHENVSVAMSRATYSSRVHAMLPPLLHLLLARCSYDPWTGYSSYTSSPPDVVIGCGRTTVALCAGYKQAFPGVFNIQIQHPRAGLRYFDAVVAPFHDFPYAAICPPPPNVHLTPGTMCDISAASLTSARQAWHDRATSWAHPASSPKIAVLVGGSCRGYTLTLDRAAAFVSQLEHHAHTASFLVTFSRRTPHDVARFLYEAFSSFPSVYIWDGIDPNPFLGFLAHATAIVTTPDSISMVTEAIASGVPTFVFDRDITTGKFQRFHRHVAPWVAEVDSLDVAALTNLRSQNHPNESTTELGQRMDNGVVRAIGTALLKHWQTHDDKEP
ncbi:hypothetical protein H310_07856 [Aphanomyces invadans]|uniref:Mitochondrial fission protein ELM1 n=1 Tax=Aphanomyces invadans TaxID=157072 RepID=A0A024U080_9STRA|nr:hypothetical protein H310_07856 [Aphanomyces invadans]ETV99815.1 hypothetical protein H310_07856 [Aphanomyces invadans]|eukprot:XP_008871591.1 hypothetical protein H310_07856 [Aphanomyces invadans]